VNTVERDTVQLLRRLHQRLVEEGYRVQGDMMGKVADQIVATEEIDPALERLYMVQGWDSIALRLMWYSHRTKGAGGGMPMDALLDYQVDELFRVMTTVPSGAEAPPAQAVETPSGVLTGPVFEALHEFSSSLEDLRKTAFEGERIEGMRQGVFDLALSHAGRLHQVSSAGGNEVLAQFAAAFSLFLRYVIERDLFDDVRVAHVIDNATQALQGVLERAAAEDYDALAQTIDMLQNPETLLE
jgi:hypothetical protein